MSSTIDVAVPDLGDFHDIPVIEVLVKPGDRVKKDDPLVTLESEKASMEVPSSAPGVVKDVKIAVGDKVSQGTVIVSLESDTETKPAAAPTAPPAPTGSLVELTVPDIGDFSDIPVIDVMIKPGDRIEKEQSLVTLESEKASMDVPASAAGTIAEVLLKNGDKVSRGTVIATLRAQAAPSAAAKPEQPAAPVAAAAPVVAASAPAPASSNVALVHASPAIRRFARELGVDLHGVSGSGPHGRITREDVQSFVKRAIAGGASPAASGGTTFAGLPAWPKVDFAQYGAIERKPLPRIKKFSGPESPSQLAADPAHHELR